MSKRSTGLLKNRARPLLYFSFPIIITLILVLIIILNVDLHPGKKFIWPIDLPKSLSGTLGEMRGHHFHQGLDIKTKGRNGFPVYAATSGRVHKITSKNYGYGNLVILNHGGSLFSAYAHLDRFEEKKYRTDSLVKILKSLYNSDRIAFTPYNSRLYFKRGEQIAFSGETGSGPPHLHFEIRDRRGTVNPIRYIPIKDKAAPVIDNIFICAQHNGTTVFEEGIGVRESWGKYKAERDSAMVPINAGKIFIKLSCYDRAGAKNRVGVYRIRLISGDKCIFDLVFDLIKWKDFRYARYMFDRSRSIHKGKPTYTHFLCRRAGNLFSGLHTLGNGYIKPKGKKTKIRIEVYDYAGNKSDIEFNLVQDKLKKIGIKDFTSIKRYRATTISSKTGEMKLMLYRGSLFRNTNLKISTDIPERVFRHLEKKLGISRRDIVKIYSVEPFDAIYKRPFRIYIKRPLGIAPFEAKKTFVYNFFEGGYPVPLKTEYSIRKDIFTVRSKANGFFAIIRDNKPPVMIMPPTHEFVYDIEFYRKIRLIPGDSLSGIDFKSLLCFIDGEIFSAGYDRDRKWIELSLPKSGISKGLHHIAVFLKDRSGNPGEFRGIFSF